ncbi:hypothetical protein PATY110618_29335 [Paenibacillus typhae]|uniref:Uncharacterized protein n=2 Tax=Paenibacillus typhae TaxID=1174501 RepID=A0A1G8TLW4_9BACL|nr:hypothetical protein SAMN05216192_11718 [Paenibacillus typhae]
MALSYDKQHSTNNLQKGSPLMKQKLFVICTILLIVLGAVTVGTKYIREYGKFVYEQDKSYLYDFLVSEAGDVTFSCQITVSNHTRSNSRFTMQADLNKELGLVKERYAYAYKGDTDVPEVFDIAAGATATYDVKFKAQHGEKTTKTDRLPPDNILFEIQ